ncbi:alpha/beta hydrolase-fold protein [Actinoallomurus purpureus]|uniref:alpha/beta hydrolase n=1 Tax=Actinoallomurus purpureus TaxID=478114 RepID=UPI00209305F4|nr:alpha/beta hydrolase-fold protein [Actinoallomurus purpureus]MCO6007802.1 alpha/beta hydrolase-fold protein [Actinoallomurus purpureus]
MAALGIAYVTVDVGLHHGAADTRRPRDVDTPSPARPGLSQIKVTDPTDHKTYGVYVWRPDVPETRTLPVLYFLHGVPSDPKTLIDDEGLAKQVSAYVAKGGTPFVLAVPDGNGSHHDDTEWANAADGSDRVEDRVLDEVIPAVEGGHRRDAAHRAIGGFSMGGYGSMNLALRHPDVFGSVTSISGYFHVDDPSHMFGDKDAVVDANRPDQNVAAARRVRIFLSAAESEDNDVIKGEPQRFKKLLDTAGVPAVLDVRAGGHDWDYVRSVLPDAFGFLAQGWAKAGAPGPVSASPRPTGSPQ